MWLNPLSTGSTSSSPHSRQQVHLCLPAASWGLRRAPAVWKMSQSFKVSPALVEMAQWAEAQAQDRQPRRWLACDRVTAVGERRAVLRKQHGSGAALPAFLTSEHL